MKEKFQEIIINRCFGGFGISNRALFELIKLGAKCVQVFTVEKYYGNSQCHIEEVEKFQDLGDGFKGHIYYNLIIKDGKVYHLKDRSDARLRTDANLIKVVKEMKKEAWGRHAELKIVRVPKDVSWTIDEYDGVEHVAEVHRTWN